MIPLIPFDATCVIYRNLKEKDEYGNPLTEEVYNGSCNYQAENAVLDNDMLQSSPIAFLPIYTSLLRQGDFISISYDGERTVEGSIYQWIISDFEKKFGQNYKDIKFTKIWISLEKHN